jgi:hypothetical protein
MLFFARRKKFIKTNKKCQRLAETKTTRGRKRKAFGEKEEPTRLTFLRCCGSFSRACRLVLVGPLKEEEKNV